MNKPIRVYVAGCYSADNVIDVLKNIGRGEYYCAKLFQLGFAPFNPWADRTFIYHFFNNEFTVKQFYDYSIAWLEVSQCVYLVNGWQKSKGTKTEIKIAKKLNISVFENIGDLVKFREAQCK